VGRKKPKPDVTNSRGPLHDGDKGQW
jgi:hypothetical protein